MQLASIRIRRFCSNVAVENHSLLREDERPWERGWLTHYMRSSRQSPVAWHEAATATTATKARAAAAIKTSH